MAFNGVTLRPIKRCHRLLPSGLVVVYRFLLVCVTPGFLSNSGSQGLRLLQTLIGSRALSQLHPGSNRYNEVAHILLEQPDETPSVCRRGPPAGGRPVSHVAAAPSLCMRLPTRPSLSRGD